MEVSLLLARAIAVLAVMLFDHCEGLDLFKIIFTLNHYGPFLTLAENN